MVIAFELKRGSETCSIGKSLGSIFLLMID